MRIWHFKLRNIRIRCLSGALTWFIEDTMRGGAVHKNHHNPTLYIESLPQTNLFIMVASPGHILESKKRDRIKLDTYIDVNERKSSRLLLPYILLELSLLIFS